MSNYTIPASLRRKPDIDQVLQYGNYYRDAEDEYIRLLSKEQEFMSRYPNEFSKFKSQFKYEKPKKHEVSSSVLYNVMAERKQSSVYDQAIIQFWFLCQATKECDRLTSYQNSAQTRNYSTTVQVNPTNQSRTTVSVPAGAATIHYTGRQQSGHNVVMPEHRDMKLLEEQTTHLNNLVNDQGDEIKELRKKEKENVAMIEDLRSRLSGLASKQLTEGNPNFTDLSDKNRPTKIAEKFHSVYDEEWTNALEILSAKKSGVKNEEEAIFILMQIIKTIYNFCVKVELEQASNIVLNILNPCETKGAIDWENKERQKTIANLEKQVVNMRRTCCFEPIPGLIEKYKEIHKEYQSYKMCPEVVKYTDKCVEYIWLMRSSDPPMVLKWAEQGETFDTSVYNHYQKKGDRVSMAVWPVVFLYEGGPIMHKGFAKPM